MKLVYAPVKYGGTQMITESFSDSTGSFVRIVGDERDRISDTVIGSGCISGICPLSIEKVNGHREYVYEVTGFISLSEYIEENGITKRQLTASMLAERNHGLRVYLYLNTRGCLEMLSWS